MRPDSHADIGSTTAFDTRYDVSTHVLSSWPADRLPAMWGKATFAMLVSSTSMNVASVTVMAIAHGLWRGRQLSVIAPRPWAPPTGPGAGVRARAGRCGSAGAPAAAARPSRNC